MNRPLLVFAFATALSQALASAQSPFEKECDRLAAEIGSDSQRLQRLFELD